MKQDSTRTDKERAAQKPIIGVLGLGRFGGALFRGLQDAGYEARGRTRNSDSDGRSWVEACDVLCLAVRNDQIAGVASWLLGMDVAAKTVMIHAGTTPLDILAPLERNGAMIGKLHPLQTFSQTHQPTIPPGTPFAVEGRISDLVEPWVQAWSGKLYPLKADQWTPYHLAAVVAANFLPLFIRSGAEVLASITSDRAEALDWLRPLVEGSVAAALDADNAAPFSGPAIRGDLETLARHEQYLQKHWPELLPLYKTASDLIQKTNPKPSTD